jgi:uncharacterized protein YecT (DUF1311 family)
MLTRFAFLGVAFLLPAFFPQSSGAASFDCAKAASAREKAICADPGLSRADEELGAAYKAALALWSSKGWSDFLRSDQREWLQNQAEMCKADRACLARDYTLRLGYLRSPLLKYVGRYVQGRCPGNGFYLDATPTRENDLEVLLYVCPDPKGNMYLQASGVPDAGGLLAYQESPGCRHQLVFAQDRVTVTAARGNGCGGAADANGAFLRDPAKSPYELETR